MTPFNEIVLSWRGHKAALWCLGLLYRRPQIFIDAVVRVPHASVLWTAAQLLLHALPYLIGFQAMMLLAIAPEQLTSVGTGGWIASGIAAGMAFGNPVWTRFGIGGWIAFGIATGIAFGNSVSIEAGIAVALGVGIAFGIGAGIEFGMSIGIVFGVAAGIGLGMSGGTAFGIRGGIEMGIAGGIAVVLGATRAYYTPISFPFVWPRVHASWYRHHPAAWDDLCGVPFWRLDRLLVAFAEGSPEQGMAEIDRIAAVNRYQRPAAFRAKATLLARSAAKARTLHEAESIARQLPEGDKGFLRETGRVREGLAEIVALQNRVDTAGREMFREPAAELLVKEIENFRHRMAGLQEPLRTEFQAAASQWQEMARRQRDEIRRTLEKEPIRQVFRAGDPANRNTEAFVTRQQVIGQIEQQVMLSTGCPGIVLCGRRRRGKSTILANLDGFLPGRVRIATLSLQDPRAFTDLASLVRAVGTMAGAESTVANLPELFDALSARNRALAEAGRRLVLAIDEYEQIDAKIAQGVFPMELLDTLRVSIQTHRAITWILAGSKEISELPNAPWSSYLVSARQIDVPVFTRAETRQLLTEPVRYSNLWEKDSPMRPRFSEGFWGPGGIERIYEETGGWPHLVQLVAETVVDLLNEGDQRDVSAGILDEAFRRSIVRGHPVLYELMHRESFLAGEWEYLERFADRERQAAPPDAAIARSLRRREIVTVERDKWRLAIPLMRRWLIERGWR